MLAGFNLAQYKQYKLPVSTASEQGVSLFDTREHGP